MSSDPLQAAILYLALYRVSIVAVGAMSIYLGYRLFVLGVSSGGGDEGTGLEAELGGSKFALRNAAPGTVFALFGALVVSAMIIDSPPEASYSNRTVPSNGAEDAPGAGKRSLSSEEFTLRGTDSGESDSKLAVALNDLAWDAIEEEGDKRGALILAILAAHISPETADILDTLADMLYEEGLYGQALVYKERAVSLNARLDKNMEKFRAAARQ